MSFIDALVDTCSVYRVTTQNVSGQEKDIDTLLYAGIKCRFSKAASREYSNNAPKEATDVFPKRYALLLEPDKLGILVDDKVILDNIEYTIVESQEIRGRTPTAHHIFLSIIERE